MVKVLASTITRGRTSASMMAATVASSAAGLGRLVMMVRHLGRERLRVGRDLHPGARHGAAARGIDVVAHHPPAVGDEVLRERAAHDAKSDDTDFALRHSQPP